jgi:spore maturation protein CgeB
MGAGGFLLSNYQSEFYDFFEPGSDMVIFESEQDLLDKCRYYLAHDAERAQIAANGLGKIKDNYTYKNILTQMLEIAMN